MVWLLDRRHRNVALRNLTMCLGAERSPEEIRNLAAENLRRIGENFACAVKTSAMTYEELRPHLEFGGNPQVIEAPDQVGQRKFVVAIGHFGNFEMYARLTAAMPGFELATTYRDLRQPALSRLLLSMRERSGCHYFERRADAHALKAFMNGPRVMLGLLADQHAGNNGLRLPFFGHDCSTSAAPALFALRYHARLFTGICYRIGLAKWRIEAGDEIPTHEDGNPRSLEAIMVDVNRALEAAVRRDPANWFWVHNRWKPAKSRKTKDPVAPEPAAEVPAG
jgi:KDO2-lipid IV(A) lauroyltransferase